MLLSNILNPKIIISYGECDWTLGMVPETGDKIVLAIPFVVQPLCREMLGNDACLWKSIHAASSFEVNETVFVNF